VSEPVAIGAVHGRVAVGHPIDVATGEFFLTRIDHELGGIVPLSLGRTYNTKFLRGPMRQHLGAEDTPSPLGPGWRWTWLSELRVSLSGFVYTRPDGTEIEISDPTGPKSLASTGRIFSAADGVELRRVGERHVRIIGYGRDRAETTLLFERWSNDRYRLAALERTREARIDVVYDERGRPAHLVQRRERRRYDLVYEGERIARAVLHLPDGTSRLAADYEYDAEGRLVTVRDNRGMACAYRYDDRCRMVRDETRGGSVYTVRYDREGRCVYACGTDRYEERSLRYDKLARSTWVTDSHGNVTRYEYNAHGQVMKTTSPTGEVTRAEFDDRGRPLRNTSEAGEVRQVVYDELGRLVGLETSGGVETRMQYDDEHRLVGYEQTTDGELATRARFAYDDDHNVTSVQVNECPAWQYTWTAFGELSTVTAPSGATAHRYYDELGALRRVSNFDGQAWTWTRDALGRVLTETDPLGHTWRVEYLDDDGKSLRLLEPDGRISEREVSPDERTIRHRLPGNRARLVELSFCGQPIAIQDEEGAVTRLSWGTEPGELLVITNANGFEYTFSYDADQRLIERQTFDGRVLRTEWKGARIVATYDGMGRRTEYDYDARGLVTKQTNEDGETSLEYDNRGLLESVTTASSKLTISRDDLGRIVAEDQDSVRIEQTLDMMGRPVAYKTPLGSEASFSWSAGGLLEGLRYGATEIAFERDAVGRETKRHLGSAGVFEQAYDAVGHLVAQVFRSGAGAGGQARDASTPAGGVSRHFGFDERGFLASIEDSLRGATRLMHNQRGDLTGVVRQQGQSDFYAYDACHNRVFHAATEHGAALATALDRVARERSAMGDVPVDVLAARVPHEAASFGYASGDRVVVVSRADGHTELTYDANGQVTSKTVFRGTDRTTWKYSWNARGELARLTTPNGKEWTYRYDGLGRRIEKRSPTGDTWRYVWRGAVLLHTLKNGEVAETYVHAPGGACPLLRDDGALHFILPDQNESPSEEVSAHGKLEWAARKGTWGDGFNAVGASGGEPFLGQWYDAESGLHYNFFRYYDPEVGRYLSADPIELLGGLNAYSSLSDSFTKYDRYGLSESSPPGSCGGSSGSPKPRPSPSDEGADYELYTAADGTQRIRFRADQALTLQEAAPGRNYSVECRAALTADGKVYVHEGRHRAIGAAHGDAIPPDVGGVPGRPGWLDYQFEPETAPSGGVPVNQLSIDYTKPDVGRDEARSIRRGKYGVS